LDNYQKLAGVKFAKDVSEKTAKSGLSYLFKFLATTAEERAAETVVEQVGTSAIGFAIMPYSLTLGQAKAIHSKLARHNLRESETQRVCCMIHEVVTAFPKLMGNLMQRLKDRELDHMTQYPVTTWLVINYYLALPIAWQLYRDSPKFPVVRDVCKTWQGSNGIEMQVFQKEVLEKIPFEMFVPEAFQCLKPLRMFEKKFFSTEKKRTTGCSKIARMMCYEMKLMSSNKADKKKMKVVCQSVLKTTEKAQRGLYSVAYHGTICATTSWMNKAGKKRNNKGNYPDWLIVPKVGGWSWKPYSSDGTRKGATLKRTSNINGPKYQEFFAELRQSLKAMQDEISPIKHKAQQMGNEMRIQI
jgi:hypothetical protein